MAKMTVTVEIINDNEDMFEILDDCSIEQMFHETLNGMGIYGSDVIVTERAGE